MNFLYDYNRAIILLAILLCASVVFIFLQNNLIQVSNIEYMSPKIPEAFNGFKILQVSDLHSKEFGKNQAKLVKYTKDISPNIIVITGDIIYKRNPTADDVNVALSYVKQAVEIAPVYFITGNHEARISFYPSLKQQLINLGATVLENQSVQLETLNSAITLMGLQDPNFYNNYEQFSSNLKDLMESSPTYFNILLSHRPEEISLYEAQNVNLVFSGHAHGGQVRLPFVGGLYAPNQGVLPKYTSGVYHSGNTSMVVSRGLGKSIIPMRVFNRPELVVATLKSSTK